MKHVVITICREYGSDGHEIGKELSERLGIPLYDKDLLEMAARKSRMDLDKAAALDEQISQRITSNYWFMSQDILSDRLFREEKHLIEQLAEQKSCIIVGRLADYILRERTDCLKVFIRADFDSRAETIRAKYGITKEEAARIVRKGDAARNGFYQYYTNGKWEHGTQKDITLNRTKFGIQGCVDILERLVREYYN